MEKAIKNPRKAEETIASAETPAHTNSLAGYGASLRPHGPGPPAWQEGDWRVVAPTPLPHPRSSEGDGYTTEIVGVFV